MNVAATVWFGLSMVAIGLFGLGMITIGPWRRHR
jgi:hypothetical protein